MRHLVAIDAGGTSSRAALVDDRGHVRGMGRGGRGNPVSAGPEAAAAAITAAVTGALQRSGADGGEVDGVTVALAGGSVHADVDWLAGALAQIGVRALPVVVPDMLALFCSGTPDPAGYGLVVGTGATAVRVEGGRVARAADGLGWLLGDAGSGFWIGRRVARAVAGALDGRAPSTGLVTAVLDRLGVVETGERADGRPRALGAMVSSVYRASPLGLAELAPLAFVDPSDPVAARIVDDAAAALADGVHGVMDPAVGGPLVIGGGVVTGQPRLLDGVLARLRAHGLESEVHAVVDGLAGAAVLALREGGAHVDRATFDRVVAGVTAARTP